MYNIVIKLSGLVCLCPYATSTSVTANDVENYAKEARTVGAIRLDYRRIALIFENLNPATRLPRYSEAVRSLPAVAGRPVLPALKSAVGR